MATTLLRAGTATVAALAPLLAPGGALAQPPAPAVARTAGDDVPTGVLEFSILEGAEGTSIPGRLTFVPLDGRDKVLFPGADADPDHLAVRRNVVYALAGRRRITVPAGRYAVYASRGIEWSAAALKLEIEAGGETSISPVLFHEVDTSGWISGDFHLHTLTYSGHGDANMKERIISLVGEGVEFAVATDHNHHTDYGPTIDGLGTGDVLTAVTGNEVSVPVGHFNAFPLDPARSPVDKSLRDANELFARLRAAPNAFGIVPVIQVNHPRWDGIDYFRIAGLDPATGAAEAATYSADFDTVEVLNENTGWGYYQAHVDEVHTAANLHSVVRDWFNLLNRGHRAAAVGNSDSHTVHYAFAGYPRNFVRSDATAPGAIDPVEIASALRARRVFTTTGPFVDFTVNGTPMGGTTSARDGAVELVVNVQAAGWIDCRRVKVFVNGDLAETIDIPGARPTPPFSGSAPRLHSERRLHLRHDAWIALLVEGDQPLAPIVDDGGRPVLPLAVANPVWVDVDGDGTWTSPWARAQATVASAATREAARLDDHGASMQGLLILAAAEGGRPYASALVREGLSNADRMVRLRAARAAERLGDASLLPALETASRDGSADPYEGVALLRAIGALDRARLTAPLLSFLERHRADVPARYLDELTGVLPGDFARDWQVIGYFAAPEAGTVLTGPFGPETSDDPSRAYPGRTGAEVRWRRATAAASGFLSLRGLADDPALAENAGACAQTWLHVPAPRDVPVALGTDDGCRVYLNGEVVYENPRRRGASPLEHVTSWPLRAGWNRVVLQVENGTGGFGAYLRVLDDAVSGSALGPHGE